LARYKALADLAHDFVYASEMYAKLIIDERTLPAQEQTIKPITGSLTGVAGGDKYLVHGTTYR